MPEVQLSGHLQLFGPLDTKTSTYPFLWWISEREARARLRKREVIPLHFTKRSIRSVHLVEKTSEEKASENQASKPASMRRKGMGDSHDHDTDINPAGVWTIDYLSKSKWVRKVFLAVPISCLQRAA